MRTVNDNLLHHRARLQDKVEDLRNYLPPKTSDDVKWTADNIVAAHEAWLADKGVIQLIDNEIEATTQRWTTVADYKAARAYYDGLSLADLHSTYTRKAGEYGDSCFYDWLVYEANESYLDYVYDR